MGGYKLLSLIHCAFHICKLALKSLKRVEFPLLKSMTMNVMKTLRISHIHLNSSMELSLDLSNRKRFHICIAWCKHARSWENSRQLCKPVMKSRVCITVENFPNNWSVDIRLCKHRKKFSYCFHKITMLEKVKRIHFTDENISSYNIDLTM